MSFKTLTRLSLIFLAGFTASAHAVCSNPTGAEGVQIYNVDYKTMQYCNGTNWIAMNGGPSGQWDVSGTTVFHDVGNVGIGTSSPNRLMQLYSTGSYLNITDSDGVLGGSISAAVEFDATGNAQHGVIGFPGTTSGIFYVRNDQGSLYFEADKNNANANTLMRFIMDGSEIMRIDTGGYIGIGTTTPTGPLHIDNASGGRLVLEGPVGGASGTDPLVQFTTDTSSSTNDWVLRMDASSSDRINWRYDNVTLLTYETGGNVGIGDNTPSYKLEVAGAVAGSSAYVNTSDARLKTNVNPLPYHLGDLMQLRPVSFNWKEQEEDWQKGRKVGLIAQEVENIIPEVVSTAKDDMGTKSIAYGDLVPLLIQSVQELKSINDQQNQRIEALEAELEQLKN